MATHSSVHAWKIPWMEKPCRLQSMGSQSRTWLSEFTSLHTGAAATAKSLQSCPILCNPIDSSPLGFRVPGILQARTLEWVAISFFNAWKWKVKVKLLSHVRPSATPWPAAFQALRPWGSKQGYWKGVPLPSDVLIKMGKFGHKHTYRKNAMGSRRYYKSKNDKDCRQTTKTWKRGMANFSQSSESGNLIDTWSLVTSRTQTIHLSFKVTQFVTAVYYNSPHKLIQVF